MKLFFSITVLFAALAVRSQTALPAGNSMQAQIVRRVERLGPRQLSQMLQPTAPKPNEIRLGSVPCNGVAVQLAKTDNPLQLVNPAAPPRYGSPEQNVVRDPITGKVSGLKIFCISF